MVTDLQTELSEMISLGVKNITKMLMKKKLKASKADQMRRMEEVKAFAEKKPSLSSQLKLTENWFDAEEDRSGDEEEEDAASPEEARPLLADKETVFGAVVKGLHKRGVFIPQKIAEKLKKKRLEEEQRWGLGSRVGTR